MWSAEQLEIRDLARGFAEGEIRPRSAEWDERRRLDDDVFEALAELGFLGMRVPEAYGGLGLDLPTYLLVLEELARGDASVAFSVAVQNGPVASIVAERGSEAQKERILPALATGELLGAFALSEAGAGSDPSAIRTRAERAEDGGWVLDGAKKWVTNGDRAGLVIVFARTGEGEEGASPTVGAFLVDRDSDGYEVVGRERTMGLRASETVEIRLEGVRVGDDGLLGDPGRGLAYGLAALDVGRVGVAAQSVGVARAAFEHATQYASEREQFGRSIAEFGGVREKLAEMAARMAAARALAHEAGRRLEAGEAGEGEAWPTGHLGRSAACALAKVVATDAAMWITDEAVQIFGGYGYMRDYPVEKLMRDAKGAEIYEGTSEIMRAIIARDVLRRLD